MKLTLITLQAVAVVAATGSCFLSPQEATLKVGISNPGGPEELAGIEMDIGGAILLSNLEWLELDDNSLTGAIPPELGDLSSLHG